MTALFAVHALATPGLHRGPERRDRARRRPLGAGRRRSAGADGAARAAPPRPRPAADHRPGRDLLRRARVRARRRSRCPTPCRPCRRPSPRRRSSCWSLGGGCLALLIYRALRTYMLTRRFADLTVAVGCVWLGVTLWSNLILGFMTVGFLVGHVLEIAAVLLVTVPAALDIKRAGASRPLVGDLTATELVASEEAYLGPRVRALMVQLEQRDVSTEEHTPPRRAARRTGRRGAAAVRHLAPPPGGRRAAARHRQARGAAGDPQQARQAHRRGVRGDQAPPERRPQAARGARRLPGAGPRPRLRPPRAPRRLAATRAACARTSCASRPASSPSSTSTTRSSPTASTAPPGPRSAPSACSRRSRAPTTRPSSPRSSASSAARHPSSPTSPPPPPGPRRRPAA